MKSINDYPENRINTVAYKLFEMANSLFLIHLKMESLLHLQNSLVRLNSDIGNVGIHHEAEQVQNQICALAQRRVRREAILLKLEVVRRGGAAHALDHFLAELHHGSKWFRVTAKDKAKVGVEEVAVWCQQ